MADQITNYKCPSCTGPLKFSSTTGKLECEYCGGSYSPKEIEAMYAQKDEKAAEAFNKEQAKQEQEQQQNQQEQQQDQQEQQQQDQNQMSKENAEQLLRSAMQDERDVQDKVKKKQVMQGRKLEKDW